MMNFTRLVYAAPKQVVDEGGDAVGERVGVETVVERVVAVLGIEADFDIVSVTSEARKDRPYFSTEVALHLQDQSTDPFFGVRRLVGEDLLRVRIKGRTCLSTANGAKNGDPGE
jgi:hypothetical protein